MTSSSGPEAPPGAGRWGAPIALLGGIALVSVTFSVAVSSIAMGASFILLGLEAARSRFRSIPATGLEAAFAFYVAAEVVSTIFSVDRADSLYNMKRVLLIGVAYVAVFAFRDRTRALAVLGALAALGAVTAAIELVSLWGRPPELRRGSMFQIAMTEGGIRMLVLLAVGPLVLCRDLGRRVRLFLAACLVPILAGLAVSQTRGAWVAFAAGGVLLGVLWDRRAFLGLAAVAVLFFLFAPSELLDRAATFGELQGSPAAAAPAPGTVATAGESNSSRLQMAKTGWRMFLDRPVTGWGDIGLRPYYVTYVTPYTEGEGGHLHNNFTQALVTLGVPGFCAVVWLFWRLFAVIRRARLGAPGFSFRGALGAGILAAYAGFHVLGLVEYNFGDHEVMVIVWFLVGLAAALPSMPGEREAAA